MGKYVPVQVRCHPLGLVARLRWRLGLKPWRRCPDGDHSWKNVYGDGIHTLNGARALCRDCSAVNASLQPESWEYCLSFVGRPDSTDEWCVYDFRWHEGPVLGWPTSQADNRRAAVRCESTRQALSSLIDEMLAAGAITPPQWVIEQLDSECDAS